MAAPRSVHRSGALIGPRPPDRITIHRGPSFVPARFSLTPWSGLCAWYLTAPYGQPMDVDHGELHGEAPRCGKCWHRRIYHFRVVGHRGPHGRGKQVELPVDCSYWTDAEFTRCDCPSYVPVEWKPLI